MKDNEDVVALVRALHESGPLAPIREIEQLIDQCRRDREVGARVVAEYGQAEGMRGMPVPGYPAAWFAIVAAEASGATALPVLLQVMKRDEGLAYPLAQLASQHAGEIVDELAEAIDTEAAGKRCRLLYHMLRAAIPGSDPGCRLWLSRFAVRRWEIEVAREQADFASASGEWPALLQLLGELGHADIKRFAKTARALCREYGGRSHMLAMIRRVANGEADDLFASWLDIDWRWLAGQYQRLLLYRVFDAVSVIFRRSRTDPAVVEREVRTKEGRLLFTFAEDERPENLDAMIWEALRPR